MIIALVCQCNGYKGWSNQPKQRLEFLSAPGGSRVLLMNKHCFSLFFLTNLSSMNGRKFAYVAHVNKLSAATEK